MVVTQICELSRSRCRVLTDEEITFVLYKGDFSSYPIREGCEISPELYDSIIQMLKKRACIRLLNLLRQRDMTQFEARKKLTDGGYPCEVTDHAIEYAMSFGYMGDSYYASKYYDTYRDRKSRKRMECDLLAKGIGKDVILSVFDQKAEEYESEEDPEIMQIRNLLIKKGYDRNAACDEKEQAKLISFLYRKGFSYEKIRVCLLLDITSYGE